MQVSTISVNQKSGYNISSNMPFNNRAKEQIGDTSFNSLTPYTNKKTVSADRFSQVYNHINKWKNFCKSQITGKKLNTIV